MLVSRVRTKGERVLYYARRHVLALLAARSTSRNLQELARAEHPMAARLSSVLERIRNEEFVDALAWSSRIEHERAQLLRDDSPLPKSDAIGPHDSGVTVSRACRASRRRRDALALFLLVREFSPRRVIELGTNVGISSAYMAAALQASGSGKLITLEASPGRVAVAQALHQRLGLTAQVEYVRGFFDDTLESALSEPVDFAFIDGHHLYAPTLKYFERIWRHASENAVFLFDDIRWSSGMERAWRKLQSDPRFPIAIDLGGLGLCISSSARWSGPRVVSPVLRI